MIEIYKDIPGFRKYQISNLGNIRNKFTFLLIKQFIHTGNNTPYLRIQLRRDEDKKPCNFRVHRLVYEIFIGPIADNIQIDHKDRNSMRNHVDNLEAKTHLENQKNRVFKKKVSPNQMALDLI